MSVLKAQTWTTRPILLMQFSFHLLWVAGAVLGGLVGAALPIDRLVGLDFALTALFIVLGIDAYRQRPDRLTAASRRARSPRGCWFPASCWCVPSPRSPPC